LFFSMKVASRWFVHSNVLGPRAVRRQRYAPVSAISNEPI
jgi:hypothetical protein